MSEPFQWPMVSMVRTVRDTTTRQVCLSEILNDIRTGRWQHEVDQVRTAFALQGKDAANQLKGQLPAFTPSGTFSQRRNDALIDHSGLLVLDFDGLGAHLDEVRKLVQACPHTLACFVSPKGDGLKVVAQIQPDAKLHSSSWTAVADHYAALCGVAPDPARKDVAGLCFVSFDPDLYLNEEAMMLTAGMAGGTMGSRPLSDFLGAPGVAPRIQELIRQGVPEGSGPHGGRNASAFWIACQLRDGGHDQASVEKYFLEFASHCQPPLLLKEAIRTAASAFTRSARDPARDQTGQSGAGFTQQSDDERGPPEDEDPGEEAGTSGRWMDIALTARYGKAYFEHITERGTKFDGINEIYWAALHRRDHIELFEPDEQVFYRYDTATGLYRELSADLIRQEIADYLLIAGVKCRREIMEERTDGKLKAITSQLRGLAERRNAFTKDHSRFIHLANGVLEIGADGDFAFKDFSPDYFSRNQSPIIYQPDAKCPRFMEELLLPAVTPDDAKLIQKFIGLCLLGHNLIQRLLILDGDAGRGKTQLALIIQLLVGLANCTQLRTAHLGERFETYRFLKKTLLVGVDVAADFLNTPGAGVIKGLVGGDLFDAEQKGGTGSFQIPGHFNVMITSNARLRVRLEGDVGAWKRRLLIARFEAPAPKKKIPDFGRRLVEEEGSGILNWALEGLQALLQDINQTGDISLTPSQSGVVDALLAESDSLRHFLNRVVERRSGSDLTASEIIEAYALYCPEQGWNALPITVVQRQLESLMLELFGVVKVNDIRRNDRSQRGFRSVAWKQLAEETYSPSPGQEELF